MLQFIGCGSAFNTSLGNNSAFIKEGNVLFLIDCGSSTFSQLKLKGVLEGVETVKVIVTHTHPDHIGSLGDLIFYSHYVLGASVHVSAPLWVGVREILEAVGITWEHYHFTELFSSGIGSFRANDFVINYQPIEVQHVSELTCYGYLINYQGKRIYYSGDCYEVPEDILEMLDSGEIDYFYQDTCAADYEGNVHMSLANLSRVIHPRNRDKVWCMHLDEGLTEKSVTDLGFSIVKPIL